MKYLIFFITQFNGNSHKKCTINERTCHLTMTDAVLLYTRINESRPLYADTFHDASIC